MVKVVSGKRIGGRENCIIILDMKKVKLNVYTKRMKEYPERLK